MKKAIELSLKDGKALEVQTPTTSKNHESGRNRSFENLSVAPYEPFYLSSSSEKDVGLILKNMKNIVFNHSSPEQLSERKVFKVCNFDLIEKQAPI